MGDQKCNVQREFEPTMEMLTFVAIGSVKETLSSKIPVNKDILQPNPKCVLGVLSCIFSYLHAFLLLEESIYEALQQAFSIHFP